MNRLWRVICLMICAVALVSCRESAQPTPTLNPNVQISLNSLRHPIM